jgi:hypothetical protein
MNFFLHKSPFNRIPGQLGRIKIMTFQVPKGQTSTYLVKIVSRLYVILN